MRVKLTRLAMNYHFIPMIKSIWPLEQTETLFDKICLKIGILPGYCNVCEKFTRFLIENSNLREGCQCRKCGSTNRQRQMISILLSQVLPHRKRKLQGIKHIPFHLKVWNMEASRAVHHALQDHLKDHYISSEYLEGDLTSGTYQNNMMHVDCQNTHFKDNSLDIILSSDVMEHVPCPQNALKEAFRILKNGGHYIYTAPFYQHRFTNEIRATLETDGVIAHHKKPWYHDDPLRPAGALVYTVFAPEHLCEIEALGFQAKLYQVYSPLRGILGQNGMVIVATKQPTSSQSRDDIFPD